MSSIADSDAVYDISRILPQHQSALTLLNSRLQNPVIQQLNWLDLACGKGQIIAQLEDNLSESTRGKLSYTGFDISVEHTRTAERLASGLRLARSRFLHGDLDTFMKVVPTEDRFDFITCTNTAHELRPGALARILVDAIVRLTDTGELFLYDMESLTSPELGALPWRAADIGSMVNVIFECLATDFRVQPSTWNHKSCKGWTITIQRQYVGKSNSDFLAVMDVITERLETAIDRVLDARLRECDDQLNSYCKFGCETADDASSRLSALFEFWALHRAKQVRK